MTELITKIGKDKWMHFSVSAGLAFVIKYVFMLFYEPTTASLVAFSVTILIGVAKEVYDKVSGNGSPELKDLLADCIGAAIGSL